MNWEVHATITKHLLLRDILVTDWPAIHEYASDAEVVRYLDWGPNSEGETRDFIERAISSSQESPRRDYELAIVLKDERILVGSCGIHISNPNNREGWIGYCLNRRYWGKGYATEVAAALLTHGFGQLNLHRIYANCDPANIVSARVLEKAGMLREGHLREHKWAKGRWVDSLLYAILHHEWLQQP